MHTSTMESTDKMAAASRTIGLDLLITTPEPLPSAVCSPLSIAIAVGMLAGAADPPKRAALCARIGVSDPDTLSAGFQHILSVLGAGADDSPVAAANAVFTDRSIELFPRYVEFLKGFDAEVMQRDSLVKSVGEMNAWVGRRTRNLIPRLLSPRDLQNAHAVLLNALAFKGVWKKKFADKNTVKSKFHVSKQESKPVDMMFLRRQRLRLLQTQHYCAVRIPYAASAPEHAASFIAYLPDESSNLPSLLIKLRADGHAPLSSFGEVGIDSVGLPKFSLDTKTQMMDQLRMIGFPLEGEFPEMGSGGGGMVEEVIHQAVIKVDEEGTEAAAATAVMMMRGKRAQGKRVVFDRPFYFEVVHDQSDVRLFTGVYSG